MTALNIFSHNLGDLPLGNMPGLSESLRRKDRRERDRREREAEPREGGQRHDDPQREDEGVIVKRWVLVLLLTALSGAGGFIWQASRRDTMADARATAIEVRVANIERIIELYEKLRIDRERQISELQTQQKNLKETLDQAHAETNAKLDRLLYGQQRERR